jgi:hypothetical protein
MAQTKKIAAYNTNSVVGAPVLVASAALMLQGVLVGLIPLAKPRHVSASGGGAIVARGAMLQDAVQKDPKGNTIDTNRMGSYTFEGRIKGITAGGTLLTPGATYYLHSGGGITSTRPAATTGDVDIKVGYALSIDELVIEIGQEVVHA